MLGTGVARYLCSTQVRYNARMARTTRFSDQLRAAVLSAPETRYRICKETGISEANLSRFVHGEAGLTIKSIDRIWEYLELRIAAPKHKKR